MKQLKDRKFLITTLSLTIICVFTLTIAYSALSAVLTIQGNARVSAADWDIYLNNPRVTSGSATANLPVIKTSSTLEFETTLNMPGDFYEFVVDVVNAGDIDAMIEDVVKTPELTVEQAKFLKYEITYQNGESITTKQLLTKDTTMPIKVRIEYRKDLNNTDLPTSQVVLDLSLTLEYIQSDGTGSSVSGNGAEAKLVSANGDINEIGTIVTIGTEQFYTIGTEENNVKLFAMYNLHVGGYMDENWNLYPLENPTGKQDASAKAYVEDEYPFIGTTLFSGYPEGDVALKYVNDYKNIIEEYGINVESARLITLAELTNENTFECRAYSNCSDNYPWIYGTTYWIERKTSEEAYVMYYNGRIDSCDVSDPEFGVRPVIVISKDYFN